jgi:hypothetical protein
LLNLLRVRIIIDGTAIYPLQKNKPVVIPLASNPSHVVVTDGFHCSKPLEVAFHHLPVYYFKISCAVDNNRLAAGIILSLLFFLAGFSSGILFLVLLSFAPFIFFLYRFYIKKQEFIQMKPASSF